MPRESLKSKRERATQLLDRLAAVYPGEERCLLQHTNPFTLLIAVVLSAQTTDASVDRVTPELFRLWPDAQALASANIEEVREVIRSIGMYNTKARNIIVCAQNLLTNFNGEVPSTMEELISLPGVGRKTANIVLNCAFGKVEGIAVDTHVYRIATRWRLTSAPEPGRAEGDLLKVIPQERWSMVNHSLVLFGREYCIARGPRCRDCPVYDLCPSARGA